MPHINKCQMLFLNISLKGVSQEEQDTFLHILDKIEKNCINYRTQPSKIIVSFNR